MESLPPSHDGVEKMPLVLFLTYEICLLSWLMLVRN